MDVISELLRASLLSDLGDDEERVKRVRAAAQAFGSALSGPEASLVPHAVLAAFDENTSHESTILEHAGSALLDCWETFRNAFTGPPAELLRAVTLAAVVSAAERDTSIRNCAWYSLRNVADRVPAGRWAAQARSLLTTWGELASRDIAAIWTPAPAASTMKMPPVSELPPINYGDKDLIAKAKEAASNGNYNTFAQWLQPEFVAYVSRLITLSNAAGTESQNRAVQQLREFSSSLGSKIRESLAAHDRGVIAGRLRVDLLWWRQTAYSDGADMPYAKLPDGAHIAVAAASDLHALVADIAPRAVEHLLADLVANAAGAEANVNRSALAAASSVAPLPAVDTATSPRLLLDAIAADGSTALLTDADDLSAPDAAVLVFRELQARRLTTRVVVPDSVTAEKPEDGS